MDGNVHVLSMWFSINTIHDPLSLSVTKSASATDRRFPATLLHACVFLSQSTHPFHPAHARCGDLSFCRFTDLRTASVPAFQPAQTFMTCLTQSGPCCFFFFFFFFLSSYWKGRWKEHQSSNRHIQAPTDHFWGCVGVFYEIMPPCRPLTGSEFTNVRVFLTFLEVCKFTTFCDRKG